MRVVEVRSRDQALLIRYNALFDRCERAFIQQSSHWAHMIAPLGPDEPIFLLCEDDGQDIAGLPLYLYSPPSGSILTSVPQAGPLGGIFHLTGLSPEKQSEAYRCLLDAAKEIAAREKCLTLTVISNPFRNDRDLYERFLQPEWVLENFTQYLDLSEPAQRSHGHRNNLNKAKKRGFRVEVCTTDSDFNRWYDIHCERHGEIGATPLDHRLLYGIFKQSGPLQKSRLFLVRFEQEIAAGALLVYHQKIADVFMLSVSKKFMEDKPNFVAVDESIGWASQAGVEIYNWQSSENRRSGVYDFKRQWGSRDIPYFFLTKCTGAVEDLKRIGSGSMKVAYKGHYVLPFQVWKKGFQPSHFKKDESI